MLPGPGEGQLAGSWLAKLSLFFSSGEGVEIQNDNNNDDDDGKDNISIDDELKQSQLPKYG